jgi:hypothetical protein
LHHSALKSEQLPAELLRAGRVSKCFSKNIITVDSPAVRECFANWQATCPTFSRGQKRGIPVTVSGAVNHKDCPPFMSDLKGMSRDQE